MLAWDCNWILFMHGCFWLIRLIHLIGWKSLNLEKTQMHQLWIQQPGGGQGQETWNLCGCLRQPSFLWLMFTPPPHPHQIRYRVWYLPRVALVQLQCAKLKWLSIGQLSAEFFDTWTLCNDHVFMWVIIGPVWIAKCSLDECNIKCVSFILVTVFYRPQQSCEGYVFPRVCLSTGGVPGYVPPPGTRYTHPPGPGTRNTPQHQVHPPLWDQVQPPGRGTPPRIHLLLQMVCILLECLPVVWHSDHTYWAVVIIM